MAGRAGRLKAHYLPYPNPRARAPAHHAPLARPSRLSWLLGLGGDLEVRSNWRLYLEEWQVVLESLGVASTLSPLAPAPEAPLSPFEAKYLASGHACYALRAELGAGGVPAPNWSAYQARCEAPEAFISPALSAILAALPLGHPKETLAGAVWGRRPCASPRAITAMRPQIFFPAISPPETGEAPGETLEQVFEQMGEGGDDRALSLAPAGASAPPKEPSVTDTLPPLLEGVRILDLSAAISGPPATGAYGRSGRGGVEGGKPRGRRHRPSESIHQSYGDVRHRESQ